MGQARGHGGHRRLAGQLCQRLCHRRGHSCGRRLLRGTLINARHPGAGFHSLAAGASDTVSESGTTRPISSSSSFWLNGSFMANGFSGIMNWRLGKVNWGSMFGLNRPLASLNAALVALLSADAEGLAVGLAAGAAPWCGFLVCGLGRGSDESPGEGEGSVRSEERR